MLTAQTWEWHQSAHPTLGKKTNKHLFQNVKLFHQRLEKSFWLRCPSWNSSKSQQQQYMPAVIYSSTSLVSYWHYSSGSILCCHPFLSHLLAIKLSIFSPYNFTLGPLLYLAALSFLLSPCSDRPDVDSSLFQHGVRGGGHRAPLHPQTLQGVLPQLLYHPGLWSVHHGHPAREANVYKGNTWPQSFAHHE